MKKIVFLLSLFSLYGAGTAVATPLSNIIYSNNFESQVEAALWDGANVASDATLGSYLGNYSVSGSTTLTLTGLSPHSQLALDFDLYLFNTWDGEDTQYGKDYFSLTGDVEGSWTFTNHQEEGQSYDGSPDEVYGASGSGQTQVYRDLGLTGADFGFTVSHFDDVFTITFGGPTTQSDEWWGIDNVVVSINDGTAPVPEPMTLALFGAGLAGFAGFKKRRSSIK